MRLRLLVTGAVAVAAGFLISDVAGAMSLSGIRSRGDQLAGEARSVSGDATGERALIEKLGEVVMAYIDESDRIQREGDEDAWKNDLRSAFNAVHGPLDGIYSRHSNRLEKMSRDIMDQDGDLEALYETAHFQSSQAVAASALYYLNWLNYYGARVFDGGKRKELLNAGEKGFGQFSVGDQNDELVSESLLGRGLCYLELGNHEWARRDFKLVLERKASAERKAKARMALLDSYWRGGNYSKTVSYSKELLNGGLVPSDESAVVRYYQLQALFERAERAKGAQAEEYRREASAVMSQLRRAGKGWASKVDALMLSQVDDPAKWAAKTDSPIAQWTLAQMLLQKDDCSGAEPLLEKILAGKSSDAKRNHREARYWIGVCRFKAQKYEAAATALAQAVEGEGKAKFAAEARYLRFKALESLMSVEEPSDELVARYVSGMRDLIEQHPNHKYQDEVRYRFGEYHHATGEFPAAIEQYAAVAKDEALLLRARFGTLQSRFEMLREESDASQRTEILDEIAKDVVDYDVRAAAYTGKDVPVQEFNAKVTLLKAVHASLSGDGDDGATAALLEGFAARFPEEKDLVPQAVRMRLGALLRLGRFADAEKELKSGAAALKEEGRIDALRSLASSFAKAGRMSKSESDAAPAARVAVALYAVVSAAGGEAPGLRQRVSIAQLQEKAGDLESAAAAYREVLGVNPNTLAALRGLARIVEAQGDAKKALVHWRAYTDKVRPGDTGWFRGQYEQARLTLAAGDQGEACKRLTALRTAMPGLKDDEIRSSLKDLFADAGC